MKPIKSIRVEDVSNVTQPMFKKFKVNITDTGTDSCLMIDFADPETLENPNPDQPGIIGYGSDRTCREIFPDSARRYKLMSSVIPLEFEIEHEYPLPGNYVVTFKGGNQLPDRELHQLTVYVMEIDCRPPVVEIKNRVDDYTNGTVFWKSKPVQLYAKSFVDCNASSIVRRIWTGSKVNPETGETVEAIDLTSLDSHSKTFLYVPPFFLDRGTYRLTFSVSILSPDNSHPLLPFREEAFTHIEIVPSPIIGQLSDGAQSRIVKGWGQRLKLAPGNYSVDPDDKFNKNFTITWFCRRLTGEETINRDLLDPEQPVSGPRPQKGNPVEKPAEGEEEAVSPATDGEGEDGGGCFGKGPGRMDVSTESIEWKTDVFYAPAMTYEILVRIDPPDRASSWTGMQLVLLKRKPPSITVKCQTEALCYPHVPLGQKINPVRVGLIGVCSEDCDGELTYEWTIYGVDNNTQTDVLLVDANEYIVGANEQKMALGIEFFDRYYPQFGDFFAKLAVTNPEGDRGESDIFLHINQPPTGGSCQFSQITGGQLALLDKFMISCDGWYDPEFKPIEYYAFWLLNHKTLVYTYLMYGPDRESELILSLGNFTVGVDIKDKEGALTRLNVTEIEMEAPTRQDYDMFMESKQLESADAAGDQSRMNMVSQALSSLMNVKLVDLEDELPSTTTTTTTTTTQASLLEKAERDRLKREKELEAASRTRSKMVKSVENIMNADTLNSLEQIGSVLTAIAGKGKGVDNEAKEIVIRLLNKTVSLASTIQVESPQQLIDFCMFAVGTMGGIVNVSSPLLMTPRFIP